MVTNKVKPHEAYVLVLEVGHLRVRDMQDIISSGTSSRPAVEAATMTMRPARQKQWAEVGCEYGQQAVQ